ncbi:MAG: T9SS type A sorting domain-containing protein [Chitinophagales bacterium]|nr:T9SS type A sorting domain-containing protein [Chitinophagales bacterium]
MMTSVSDAQYAVNVQKGGTAVVESCKFLNNNFGIRTAPEGNGVHQITALGNRFATTGAGLKPSWGSGQQPAPGEKGFTGIYANNLTGGLLVDKDPDFGVTNEFSDLHYGILAENTHITVRDAIFTDILQETRPSGYPGPLFTGSAIYVSGGNADIKGNYTGIVPGPLKMDNCHVGVNTRGGSIAVEGCEMNNMTNGVVALGGINKSYTVNWNNIKASDRGISVFYQSGLPGASAVSNNIIHMAGNANGAGIAIGGQEMFPQNEGLVAGNSVTVEEGATGIQIGVANKLKVIQNNVSLAGSGARFGIRMEGGDQNTLNCNIVNNPGGGNNDGIFAIHASRPGVSCNTTDGPARGLHFEGMLAGKSRADIAGNTLENNSTAGLLLGTDAVLGPQVHRGNKFEDTEALAGIEADFNSKFTVDAAENPDFLPDTWQPINWFINVANPSASFDCGASTTCPPTPAPTPDYSLDLKIVKGELGGTTYQAANQWLSQRRFYELVMEGGNPYPGNSDVSAFLSQAQTNGLSAYANVQTGIRQLGAMSEGSRATAAANLLTLNAALTGSASYQVNEKLVNQIFLQTVAVGNLEFSETQVATLEGIAALCPLSDGEAVLRARAVLQLLQGAPADYDDLSICGGGERSIRKKMTGQSSIRVYPNPANNFLSIDFQSIGEHSCQFLMFNSMGQIIKEIALHSNAGISQLPLQDFSDGVYWYVIPGFGAGKILIQH